MSLFLKTTAIAFLFSAVTLSHAQNRSASKRTKSVRAITGFLCAGGSFEPRPEPSISGGNLTSKALVLPQPGYPAKAKDAGIYGNVEVEVVVETNGIVIWARPKGGHPLLREEVKKVVCKAQFSPSRITGIPLKVRGVIVYRFSRPSKVPPNN
jgi:TonB family protein